MECTFGLTTADMKAIGRITRHVAKASSIIQMETFSKESGKMIWPMDSDNTFMSMEQFMKDIGKTTINVALEKKYGSMAVYSKDNM